MQSYAEHSPVPFIHYQRSHMEALHEFTQEFQANRIDISTKVYRRMGRNRIGKNPRYQTHF
jgi:hypothetical protein